MAGEEKEESGGYQFFIYLFVVHPVCNWILNPQRGYPKKTALLYAVGFLVAVASAELYFEYFQTKAANYYSVLGATRSDSTKSTIKKSYREMSLKYHPDKWVSNTPEEQVTAEGMFNNVREAYEVLSNEQARKAYDVHGQDGVRRSLSPQGLDDTTTLMSMGVFYLIWSVLTFFLTMGTAAASNIRQYAYAGLMITGLLECGMKFGGYDFGQSFIPYTTPFEKCEILHCLYPAFMSGCRIIVSQTFVDMQAWRDQQLVELSRKQDQTQKMIVDLLEKLEQAGPRGKGGGGGGGNATSAAAVAKAAVLAANPAIARQQQAAQVKAAGGGGEKVKPTASGGIPSWVIMIGIYVLFNYVLK